MHKTFENKNSPFPISLYFLMSVNNLARIVVFGAEYCSFCNKAKSLLSKSGSKFSYLDIEQ